MMLAKLFRSGLKYAVSSPIETAATGYEKMALTDDLENETAQPIYWPVWTSENQLYPLGHETTVVGAQDLLQKHFQEDAGFSGRKLIGVERTARGWFPIFG